MDTNVKLSNVIGAPFSDYVLLQLYIRASRNSTVTRSNEEVLFLANKSAWARLISSVNIELPATSDVLKLTPQDYQNYYSQFNLNSTLPYNAPDSLAKNWVLEAGTSIQNGNGISLRSGIGPDGAYGLGGTEELGYRPMPGLTGVTIETTGRLGSLRQATINFKVWNMNQLNVVEALYFRLGYSMLLEWGHTQYFDNKDTFERNGIFGIDDPFVPGQRKELIQQAIALKARKSSGNYDGMLGIVSNFSWSMNQDGGYDCVVKLVGLGSVMDSMRINQAYTLPDGLLKEYKRSKSAIAAAEQAYINALEKKIKELQNPPIPPTTGSAIDPAPKSPAELRQRLQTYNNYQKFTVTDVQADYGIPAFYRKESFTAAKASGSYDYYTSFDRVTATNVKDKVINTYAGLWLNHQGTTGWTRVPTTGDTVVTIDTTLLNTAAENITYQTVEGPKTVSQLGTTGGTFVSKIFDYDTKTYITTPTQGGVTTTVDIPLTSPLNSNATDANYLITGLKSPSGNTISTFFNIKAKISKTAQDINFQPTRQELITLLDAWQAQNNSEIKNVKVVQTGNNKVSITGTFTGEVVASYSGTPGDKANVIRGNNDSKAQEDGTKRLVPVIFEFTTDNPGFILRVGPITTTPKVVPQTTQPANTGDTNGAANQANVAQTDAAEGFASALQAMLTVVQAQAQRIGSEKSALMVAIPIKSQTEKFFQDGIMNGVLNPANTPKEVANPSNSKFNLIQYASKGFNGDLMVDPSLYNTVPSVDFDALCTAFILDYTQGGEETGPSMVHAPVYIQFGYLLAFLNNMCLMYDSPEAKISTNNNPTEGTPKRPYVYIDFNPETNFCLTSPQQLSVDPFTCLIPLDGDQTSYESIFPENVVKNWKSTDAGPIFNPGDNKENLVSGVMHAAGLYFKSKLDSSTTDSSAYQGRVMNILLNVDYLLNLVKDFAGSDPEHAVRLEPFLQRILIDINKSLGNTNAFRAAYRDDSNTIQIQDDQWVPSLVGEKGSEDTVLSANEYNSKLKLTNQPKLAGLLPIFATSDPKELPVVGNMGLARQFQLRSVMSTKLASMIAISAQAATGSVNAKDHSSLSYLNQNFQDRYKPFIQDASNGEAGSNDNSKNKANGEANDQKAAELFNNHVRSIYSTFRLSADKVPLAKNYYIERMSKVKSGDVITSAAPFIPAELEMTLDGISGIIMGNAFTVPQDRLPLSLRGENGLAKIAFIVTGLTHTIQNNEWLTKIKGQMIKLRQQVDIPKATTIISKIQNVASNVTTNRVNDIITKTPWSAAFISYVLRQAGVNNFPSNAAHTGYAQSLRTNPNDFLILNPIKEQVKVGDIIIKNRDGNSLTFDTNPWQGDSHGDIVASIEGNTAVVIGGNISNTVYKTNLGLINGRLGKSDYFVILRPPQDSAANIARVVINEYKLWNTRQWKETTPAALPSLSLYYKAVGINL